MLITTRHEAIRDAISTCSLEAHLQHVQGHGASRGPSAVGCHYFPPSPQLPSQPLRRLLPVSLLLVKRGTVGVNIFDVSDSVATAI